MNDLPAMTNAQKDKLASLARIEVPVGLEITIDPILNCIAKVKEVDVQNTDPLIHPAETMNVFRDDVIKPSLPRMEALKNAPDRNDEFFIVPKVMEP